MAMDTRTRDEVEVIDEVTSGGHVARFAVRPETNDSALVRGIIGGNEYPFHRLQGLTGYALDIGAHIGIVSVALALDNPSLRIVAVEALRENWELLRRNVALNGLGERVETVCGAAGTDEPTDVIYDYETVPGEPDGYVRGSRFIGNIYSDREGMVSKTRSVRGVSLSNLLASFAIERVALLKLDCEGCEWTVLRDSAIDRVDRIIGEAHGDPRFPGLRKLLAKTHRVTQLDANPVNPLFEAIHR